MPQIEVKLEVPLEIAKGLAIGQLKRVGGVVVDASTKQVVAWLREGGKIADNKDLAEGLLKTVLQANAGGLASTGINVLNAAVTARSHFLITQELQALTNLVGMVGGIGVLNLAATVISTAVMLKRLRDLESAIEGLYGHISREFTRDRQVKLEAAIQVATDALNFDRKQNMALQANAAMDKLFMARQHIWLEVEQLKGSQRNAETNHLMQQNILQSMQLDTLRSRCLLEVDELYQAKAYLSGKLATYRETSRFLIHRHLGEHRAVYFHKSVAESDLLRYLAIEFWMSSDGDRLLEVILSNRHDFWNKDIADESKIAKPDKTGLFALPKRGNEKSEDRTHIEALTQCELLIENLERFEGFHAEIEAMERLGINHTEWAKEQDEAMSKAEIDLAEHRDYVLLVDNEQLERLAAA